ncbi:hypothetical protein Goshw_002554 [Gossypium schwendimanii]|uniref:Uncharacterized protein n=1 Tax=Gossypium schwendimanii TaxID=34291 RepID=A0A7J9LL36_GOSSC|nr:hypothetical protein [Gossypium schwendimanii]
MVPTVEEYTALLRCPKSKWIKFILELPIFWHTPIQRRRSMFLL